VTFIYYIKSYCIDSVDLVLAPLTDPNFCHRVASNQPIGLQLSHTFATWQA